MANLARNLLLLCCRCNPALQLLQIQLMVTLRLLKLCNCRFDSHLPKINCRLTLENGGKSAVKLFLVAIPPSSC